MSTFAEFAAALPKAELHIHLEGSLEAELLFEVAERNRVTLPWATVADLRAAYQFDDLQSFLNLYFEGCQVLVTEQDFYDLTTAYLIRAHADGVVRVEAFLGPQTFLDRGIAIDDILGGVLRAMDDAAARDGISAALIVSAQRHRSEAEGLDLIDAVLPWSDRIVAFGLGGAEIGNPPAKFQRYFARVRELGFRATAHAGEEGPASNVRDTVELLGVDRVDHGVRVMDDPALVRELAASGIPFTVCPVSNLVLNVVPDLASHPLPAMIQAGLNVTVNSDDPSYFGGYVLDNYLRSAEAFGFEAGMLASLAANSIRSSFLPDDVKGKHLIRIDELLASHVSA
jgi:adenosine deaminase